MGGFSPSPGWGCLCRLPADGQRSHKHPQAATLNSVFSELVMKENDPENVLEKIQGKLNWSDLEIQIVGGKKELCFMA